MVVVLYTVMTSVASVSCVASGDDVCGVICIVNGVVCDKWWLCCTL